MSTSLFRSLVAAAGLCVAAGAALAQHTEHSPPKTGAPGKPVAQPAHESDEVVPYLAGVCPISGKKLGAMGDPVVREYDGREVRFCCSSCVPKFEGALEEGWKKLDALMIEDQLPYYPLTTCIISGEPLTEDGEDIAVNMIVHNRLVRLCCRDCVKDLMKDPDAAFKKLDAASAEQQRAAYPLKTCVVSGDELGEMGDPYELVVGNRLVRLCCDMCEEKLLADPLKFLAPLDAAWKETGIPAPLDEAPTVEHEDEHHEDEGAHDHKDHDDHGG